MYKIMESNLYRSTKMEDLDTILKQRQKAIRLIKYLHTEQPAKNI